ncbi:MAG: TrmB family transcriptional regulator [Candidatus Doudnabacteria bacterium]|nr:TrmB family transcriptional regulator [Candidatus Doudnabacteria bacterium]
MDLKDILEEFGLTEKESLTYLSLLELGPSPARAVARKSGINRGTAYDILKKLVDLGLASFYRKGKQHFSAEAPERLIEAVEDKQTKLQRLKLNIVEKLPELKTMFVQQGGKPSIRVYEGSKGVKKILEDVLNSVYELKVKEYYVYSSSTSRDREIIYKDFPDFNDKRINKGINVKTISLGQGGELSGLDARKWIGSEKNKSNSTHELIYAGKIAHIGLDSLGSAFGVIVENGGIYETQKLIFERLWDRTK